MDRIGIINLTSPFSIIWLLTLRGLFLLAVYNNPIKIWGNIAEST